MLDGRFVAGGRPMVAVRAHVLALVFSPDERTRVRRDDELSLR
jgi:hypothetical protein